MLIITEAKKLISLCAEKLGLSIRYVEILQIVSDSSLESLIGTRVESFGNRLNVTRFESSHYCFST